jgi:ABC-type lipoprotein release transport system permease subunit
MKGSSLRVGIFLALRQIKRSSIWTTSLIIFVMFLTFLNLVLVTGVLVGIVQGSLEQSHELYSGDVIISSLSTKNYIENSQNIIRTTEAIPEVKGASARYIEGGVIQANYKMKSRSSDRQDEASTEIVGIDPTKEELVTGLSSQVEQGVYLNPNEEGYILLGSSLMEGLVRGDAPGLDTISNVKVGEKVRLIVAGNTKELTVKGIIQSKDGNADRRAFVLDRELRKMIGRSDLNVDEIAIRMHSDSGSTPEQLKWKLLANGFDRFAKIQTWEEALGQFLEDITFTFTALGTGLGSIGLAVASITIFIVIFINAITRQKFIGILKGIGIRAQAIEISYVIQSFFYAIIGSGLGVAVLYGILVPYVDENPINFPFSDGVLYAPLPDVLFKVALLIGATIIAGYIPAKMIIRKNTLDSILGR